MLNASRRKSRRINCRSFTDLYLPKQLFHTTSFTIHAAKQRFRATSFTVHTAKQRFRATSFTVHTVKQFFCAARPRLHGSDCPSDTLNTSRRKSRRINCRSFTDLYLPKQLFHAASFTVHAAKQLFHAASFTVHAVKQRFRAVKHSSDCKTTVSCDVFRNSCHKETVSYNEPHGLCRGSAAL